MTTYGQTYLQLVNTVLARLREASVATVTETTYSTFISKLLNQVKHEIEQAYYWNALRDTYSVNTVAGTTAYTFTGAGPDARVLNGWNMTSPCPLKRGTNTQFDKWYFGVLAADIQTGATTHYIPAGVSPDYDLKVDVWPKPDRHPWLPFALSSVLSEIYGGIWNSVQSLMGFAGYRVQQHKCIRDPRRVRIPGWVHVLVAHAER